MAPILNSTTGMIPQVLESHELRELLNQLNTLQPLPDVKVASSTTSSDNRVGGSSISQGHEHMQSDHQALLHLVQKLTELLHPYKDHWSFDEMVRLFSPLQFFLMGHFSLCMTCFLTN